MKILIQQVKGEEAQVAFEELSAREAVQPTGASERDLLDQIVHLEKEVRHRDATIDQLRERGVQSPGNEARYLREQLDDLKVDMSVCLSVCVSVICTVCVCMCIFCSWCTHTLMHKTCTHARIINTSFIAYMFIHTHMHDIYTHSRTHTYSPARPQREEPSL